MDMLKLSELELGHFYWLVNAFEEGKLLFSVSAESSMPMIRPLLYSHEEEASYTAEPARRPNHRECQLIGWTLPESALGRLQQIFPDAPPGNRPRELWWRTTQNQHTFCGPICPEEELMIVAVA